MIRIFIFLMLFPTVVFANVAIPTIAVGWPFMLLLFIPVVLVEALFYSKTGLTTFKAALKPTGIANIISTLAGYPIAWGLQWALHSALYGSKMPKGEEAGEQIGYFLTASAWTGVGESWEVAVAIGVSLIPAYFLSVYLEQRILVRYFPGQPSLFRSVAKANFVSYALLGLILAAQVFWYLMR